MSEHETNTSTEEKLAKLEDDLNRLDCEVGLLKADTARLHAHIRNLIRRDHVIHAHSARTNPITALVRHMLGR